MDNDETNFYDQIYKQNAIAGVVPEYRRSDQNADLSIQPIIYLSHDYCADFIEKESDQQSHKINSTKAGLILEEIQKTRNEHYRLISFYSNKTPLDTYYEVKRGLLRLKNSYKTKERIILDKINSLILSGNLGNILS